MTKNLYCIKLFLCTFLLVFCFQVAGAQSPKNHNKGKKKHDKNRMTRVDANTWIHKSDSLITTEYIDNIFLDEVVVTGSRSEIAIKKLPVSITTVESPKIAQTRSSSVLPVLTEQVPGLFTTARGVMGYGISAGGAGNISMRGIGGNPTTGVLILIDGQPQYMGIMGHPIPDIYESNSVKRIEVVRGPASMLYGSNAMGGVINILTNNKHLQNGFKGRGHLSYGSYNTLNSNLGLSYKKKYFSANAGASYKRTNGHRDRMDFEQYSFYTKLYYNLATFWDVYADINVTHFNSSNPGMVDKPIYENDSRITRGMASVSIENDYMNTSGAIKLIYNWGFHKINDGFYANQNPKDFLFKSKDKMFGANLYQTVEFFRGNEVTFGIDYNLFGGKAWNDFFAGNRVNIVNKTEQEFAGYINFRQRIRYDFFINAGIRADYHTVTGTHYVPQIGLSITPSKTGEIKVLASKGFRNPSLKEMYMFPPQNPNLKPENLWNYEISWTNSITHGPDYGINAYYINGKNLIQTMIVNGKPLNVNTGKIRNCGVEFYLNHKFKRYFSINTNYSYLYMKYPVLAAPSHKFFIGLDFSKNKWAASVGLQQISGLYTSVAKDNICKENFTLLSANLSYKLNKFLDVFVKGENLLNYKYEINTGFPMPGATVIGGINFKF